MSSQDGKGFLEGGSTGDRRLNGLRRYWARKRGRGKGKKWCRVKGGKTKILRIRGLAHRRSRTFPFTSKSKFEETKDNLSEDDEDDDDPDVSEDTEETEEGDSQDEEEAEGETAEKMENLSQGGGGEQKKLLQLMSEQFNSANIRDGSLAAVPRRGNRVPRLTRKRKSDVLDGDKTPRTPSAIAAGPSFQMSSLTPSSNNPITSALKKVRKESTDSLTAPSTSSPTMTRKKRNELDKKIGKGCGEEKDSSEETASISEASEVESKSEETTNNDKNTPNTKNRKKGKGKGRPLSEGHVENDSGAESPGIVTKSRAKAQSTSDEDAHSEAVTKPSASIGRGRGKGRGSAVESSSSTPSPVGRGRGRGRGSNKEDSVENKGRGKQKANTERPEGSTNVSSPTVPVRGRGRPKNIITADANSSQNSSMSSPVATGQGRGKLKGVGSQSTPPPVGRGRGKRSVSDDVSSRSNSPPMRTVAKKGRGKACFECDGGHTNREVMVGQQRRSVTPLQRDPSPASELKRKQRLSLSRDLSQDSPQTRGKQLTIPEIIKKQEAGSVGKSYPSRVKKEEQETSSKQNSSLKAELSFKTESILKAESILKTESSLKTTESSLKTTESNLKTTESSLKTAESNLKTTESSLKTTESSLKTTESSLKTTESSLKTTESSFKTTESSLKTTESSLKTAESNLKTTESSLKAESSLKEAESSLKEAESSLKEAESSSTEETLEAESMSVMESDLKKEESCKSEMSLKLEEGLLSDSSMKTDANTKMVKKKKKYFKGLKYSFGKKKRRGVTNVGRGKRTFGTTRLDTSQETDSVVSEEMDMESIDSSSQDVPSDQLSQDADEDALDDVTSDAVDNEDGELENSTRTPDGEDDAALDEDSMDLTQEEASDDLIDEISDAVDNVETMKSAEGANLTKIDEGGIEAEKITGKTEMEEIVLQETEVAKSIPKKTVLKESVAGEIKMEGIPEKSKAKGGVPVETKIKEGDILGEMKLEERIQGNTEIKEGISEECGMEEEIPDATVMGEIVSGTTVIEEAIPEATVMADAIPGATVIEEANVRHTGMEEEIPGVSQMEERLPVDSETNEKLPGETRLEEETPEEDEYEEGIPEKHEVEEGIPGEPDMVERIPGGTEMEEQIAGEAVMEEGIAGEPEMENEILDKSEMDEENDMQLKIDDDDSEEMEPEEEIDPGTEEAVEAVCAPESETLIEEEEEEEEEAALPSLHHRAVYEESNNKDAEEAQKVANMDVYEFNENSVEMGKPESYIEKGLVIEKDMESLEGKPHVSETTKREASEHRGNIILSEAEGMISDHDEREEVKDTSLYDADVNESAVPLTGEAWPANRVAEQGINENTEILESGAVEQGINEEDTRKQEESEMTPDDFKEGCEPATTTTEEEAATAKEPLPLIDQTLRGPSRRRHSVSKRRLEDLVVEGQNSDSSDSVVGDNRNLVLEGVRKSKRLSRNSSPHPLAIAAPRSPEGGGCGSSKPVASQSSYVAAPSLTNVLCKCRIKENPVAVGITGDVYCKAVDSFDGRMIGCCNIVANHRYLRVSGKIPFMLLCDIHRQRLRRHNCCPHCGLFCTQGMFSECTWDKNGVRHYYHKFCALGLPKSCLCPHCGSDQPPREVHLELKMNRKPVIYLKQQQERKESTARITWSKNEAEVVEPEPIPVEEPKLDANGAVISAHKLPLGLDREKLQNAIRSIIAGKTFTIKPSAKGVYWACKQNDLEKLLHVLVNGVSPNVRVKEYGNQTGLHVAASYNVLAAVHVLVLAGATMDMVDMQLMSPLMVAIIKNHNDIVQYLIQAGASLLSKNQEGMTSLHLAAKCGNFIACQYIVDSGRLTRHSINTSDEGGWTPLVWASENRFINVVKFLLDRGGNPQLCDVEQNTALHWASFSGSTQICSMLLDRGCSLRSMNVHGDSPLHIAARQNHTDVVVLFLARGARIDILNRKQQAPLDCAIPDTDVYLQLSLNNKLLDVMQQNNFRTEKILSSDIAAGKEEVPIPCVNGMDDDQLPKDYLYIAENCEASNVSIDRTITSMKWCECEDGCNADTCGCGQLNFQCWYDPEGRLLPEFSYHDPPMIFECNRACRCNKLSCNNRVVQHGISAHMQLFKTDGKGWGVRALKTIQKGSYVCEYVGEIITDLEADQREDDSYLFDLDNRDSETFCIDARGYGNIARFINHLCEPNLTPVKLFIDHQDLTFPRIAFFANRDIEADEELGFDYGEKFWIIKYKHFTCTCGSEKCKYSTKTIHLTLEEYNKKTFPSSKS